MSDWLYENRVFFFMAAMWIGGYLYGYGSRMKKEYDEANRPQFKTFRQMFDEKVAECEGQHIRVLSEGTRLDTVSDYLKESP